MSGNYLLDAPLSAYSCLDWTQGEKNFLAIVLLPIHAELAKLPSKISQRTGGHMKKLGRFVLCAMFTLLLSSVPLRAQQFSAVDGVVTDKSGGVISGVEVELNNEQLGLHETTTTNELGFYQVLHQAPGQGYSLTFTKEGFAKIVVSNVALGVSTTETRNVTLEIGAVTQSIQVQASGEATLNTTDATVGNVIDARAVSELPIQFRLDAANLMQLQAGANDAGSITGSRSDQGNITLDGLDINRRPDKLLHPRFRFLLTPCRKCAPSSPARRPIMAAAAAAA